ncbi:MAG TPA: metallophosphoesterase [Bacillota bacterium]|nr:metallophosphoesterase [Bacillota bacterium]
MVKVLITSDSHGLTEELSNIKEQVSTRHMIHCGDSELDMDAPELSGFLKVAGNCDDDVRFPNEQTTSIHGLSFFITHGHLYRVKSGLHTLSYRAEEVQADIICFGHTHIAGCEQIGRQLFINPGSIRLPRNRTERTYAVVEWEDFHDVRVHFYTLTGYRVDDLSARFSLSEK